MQRSHIYITFHIAKLKESLSVSRLFSHCDTKNKSGKKKRERKRKYWKCDVIVVIVAKISEFYVSDFMSKLNGGTLESEKEWDKSENKNQNKNTHKAQRNENILPVNCEWVKVEGWSRNNITTAMATAAVQ